MADNFLIVLSGRGVVYSGMISATSLEELANRCKYSTDQGFEVYIYSLRPSPSTAVIGQFPEGTTVLKREYLLYDAHERFEESTNNIINDLAEHCFVAQKQYLEAAVARLQKELEQVNNDLASVEDAPNKVANTISVEDASTVVTTTLVGGLGEAILYPTENTNTHTAEELPPDGVTTDP